MKQSKARPSTVILGTALTGGLLLSGSVFAMNDLDAGYMQDSTGAAQEKTQAKTADTKSQATTAKTKPEGNCGAKTKAAAEGKCGEGRCGSAEAGEAMFAKMDTDKDGRVSKTEFAAQHGGSSERFASHDGNSDGFMTKEEMHAAHAKMHADKSKANSEGKCGEGKCGEGKCGSTEGGEAMFTKMDTNKDGRVSKTEFAAQHGGSSERFASHDGNSDGFMSKEEMHAAHAKMKADSKAGAEKAKTEGKCGEGKCGEGKCGGSV